MAVAPDDYVVVQCHAERGRGFLATGHAVFPFRKSMLEAHDEVVGVPDHDHVTRGFAPSPALGPEVENVVEIDAETTITLTDASHDDERAVIADGLRA